MVRNEFWLLWIVTLALIYSTHHNWMSLYLLIKIERPKMMAMPMSCYLSMYDLKKFVLSLFRDTPWLTNHHLMTVAYYGGIQTLVTSGGRQHCLSPAQPEPETPGHPGYHEINHLIK